MCLRWPTALLLASLALAGCTWEPTEVIVQLNTDAPLDRRMVVTATVRGGSASSPGSVRVWQRTDAGHASLPGVDAGVVTFPASFGIIPAESARDGNVSLVVEATLAGARPTDPSVSFRRIARFRFTPGQTTVLPLFLKVSCGLLTTGCTTVAANLCTVSTFCEEQHQTCGDDGMCTSAVTDPHPITPGDRDSGILGMDAPHADVPVVRDVTGIDVRGTDTSTGPCSGGCPSPANGTAMCVSGVCVITCAAGFGNCDGTDANGCEAALDSASHCGTCGNACPVGQLCMAGNCVPNCTAGTTLCGRSCADLQTSSSNCGACGTTCPTRANASPVCMSGTCGVACSSGFGNCDGMSANGCEVALATSLAHCGSCSTPCSTANATPQCAGGACGIASCNGGWFDLNGAAGDGCECQLDANGPDCNSASPVGPVGVGGSANLGGNLVPVGSSDWFSVSFAGGGHPHITLTTNPGGATLNVFSGCGTAVSCPDHASGGLTDWEFFDNANTPPNTDLPGRMVAPPTQAIVQVVGGGATCANYVVTVTN